jgi:acyl-CoA thioester hydrolase/1,4-dihydroxy-2-naphthoyl-CoA hydrolase
MFSKNIKVNFFNADPAGIMFFSNIFIFAHSAYESMLESGNFTRDYFNDEEFGIPIIHSEADFYKPIFPGDEIVAQIDVTEIKESSFELTYTFKNKSQDIMAIVKTVHVFISKFSWDKTLMPANLTGLLQEHYKPGTVAK